MIKRIAKLSLMTLLAATVLGLPFHASAQTNTPPTPKPKPLPYVGKLGAVDKVAKTFTLDEKTKPGRTFTITSETKITKADKPATMDDLVIGERVTGSYMKSADGKLMAHSVKIGPKSNETPKGDSNIAPAKKMPATGQ